MRWAALKARVGHRGLFLATLGLYDLFFGVYLAAGGNLEHQLLLNHRAWGWIWIGAAIALFCGAFTRRDRLFFAAAVFIKTAWALEYFRLTFTAETHEWPRAAFWLAFALLVTGVSAWPEPGLRPAIAEEAVTRAEGVRSNGGDP
jgi:lysylphosphatidylglycerol synthetase-like protein (DUF2156 family)